MKQYLAIDIGGTAVKLGIVDETGAVGPKAEESVNFDGYQTPVLTTVLKAARAFVETQNIDVNTLEGVGVSATGQIDSRKGIVAGTCGNFPNYINSPIQAELERLFGLPVTVANDANCILRSAFAGKQNDKPGYVVNGHLSSPAVAGRLKRPT